MKLLNLADVVRRSGLRVVEIPGWRTRGGELAEGAPLTIVAHHTATSRLAAGDIPTLRILRDGHGTLPGPLCQLGLSRSGVVYVVAAGRANHAGTTFQPRQSNSRSIGIEAEHDGLSPWPAAQYAAYVALCDTLRQAYGDPPVEGHKEVAAPRGRKSDPNFAMPAFRSDITGHRHTVDAIKDTGRVTQVAQGKVDPTPPPLLKVDGSWGRFTCDAWEWYLGIERNGAMDVETSSALQKWAGRPQTGALLRDDMRAIQRKLGVEPTGQWNRVTVVAMQNFLNRRIREAVEKERESQAPEPTTPPARTRGPFPLPAGHWYGRNDGTSRTHSGLRVADKEGVRQIQAVVRAAVDGVYGPATDAAVRVWQAAHGRPVTGIVDAATWQQMTKGV